MQSRDNGEKDGEVLKILLYLSNFQEKHLGRAGKRRQGRN